MLSSCQILCRVKISLALYARRDFTNTGLLFRQLELEPVIKQRQQQPNSDTTHQQQQQQSRAMDSGSGRGFGKRSRRSGRSCSGSEETSDYDWSDFELGADEEEEEEEEDKVPAAAAGNIVTQQRRRKKFDVNRATTWQRPASHAALELDLEALLQALCDGALS